MTTHGSQQSKAGSFGVSPPCSLLVRQKGGEVTGELDRRAVLDLHCAPVDGRGAVVDVGVDLHRLAGACLPSDRDGPTIGGLVAFEGRWTGGRADLRGGTRCEYRASRAAGGQRRGWRFVGGADEGEAPQGQDIAACHIEVRTDDVQQAPKGLQTDPEVKPLVSDALV